MYYINKNSDTEYSVSDVDDGNAIISGDWSVSSYMDDAYNALLSLTTPQTSDSEYSGFTLKNSVL